jgi:hypothetical protein
MTERSVWVRGREFLVAEDGRVWRAGVFGAPRRRVYGFRASEVLQIMVRQDAATSAPPATPGRDTPEAREARDG